MKIENTDRFRNKMCEIIFNDGHAIIGRLEYIPTYSEKYNYSSVGWHIVKKDMDLYFRFKDVKAINVLY